MNVKTELVNRMSSHEKEIFSEFVNVFPFNGHEPENQVVTIYGSRLDNDGWRDNIKIVVGPHVFNLATLLAFAKFGYEEGVKLQ